MDRNTLRNIVCILRELPLCRTLPGLKKSSFIRGSAANYRFLGGGENDEIVGYESSWAEIIQTEGK